MKNDVNGDSDAGSIESGLSPLEISIPSYEEGDSRNLSEEDNFDQQILALCLLALSACFMTVAWYLHLKFPELPMWIAILGSWGIAFFEYALQVPGNR